ncbi:conjugation system SOS inhibitor PsiB family protein [Acerihabitans sp. TG2]|nr:conjugation system SOS inhibitor PsiB family protein [Acerihabitans sp. TG2]MEA9390986.1 conjugation system SOS inhibitor PsiB family protein [Acerihabitans sp. TG2]
MVCVCSPGEIAPTWTVILLAGGCRRIRIVRQFERFEPKRINSVLTELAAFNLIGITAAELITAISKAGAL